MVKPTIPISDKRNKISIGFFPPTLSTHAENGILNNEPERFGAATNKPSKNPDIPKISLSFAATGPYNDTAANPIKNPNVAIASPIAGLPFKPCFLIISILLITDPLFVITIVRNPHRRNFYVHK